MGLLGQTLEGEIIRIQRGIGNGTIKDRTFTVQPIAAFGNGDHLQAASFEEPGKIREPFGILPGREYGHRSGPQNAYDLDDHVYLVAHELDGIDADEPSRRLVWKSRRCSVGNVIRGAHTRRRPLRSRLRLGDADRREVDPDQVSAYSARKPQTRSSLATRKINDRRATTILQRDRDLLQPGCGDERERFDVVRQLDAEDTFHPLARDRLGECFVEDLGRKRGSIDQAGGERWRP